MNALVRPVSVRGALRLRVIGPSKLANACKYEHIQWNTTVPDSNSSSRFAVVVRCTIGYWVLVPGTESLTHMKRLLQESYATRT